MNINDLLYEIPLFIFIILALFTIIEVAKAQKLLRGGTFQKPYKWFIFASVFFTLWAVDHIYHDLIPLPASLQIFFHYIISHGFLLISMACIYAGAHITRKTITDAMN